jgi:hypothetical protein
MVGMPEVKMELDAPKVDVPTTSTPKVDGTKTTDSIASSNDPTKLDGEMVGMPETGLRFPEFKTHGLADSPLSYDDGVLMVAQYEKMGLSREEAINFARNVINSSSTLPKLSTVSEPLYKVVVSGTKPGEKTEYFISKLQYDSLKGNPEMMANSLALPQWSEAFIKYDVYTIQPKGTAIVFESEIAGASQGAITREGGATQVIVANRNQFDLPEYIESIEVKK